MAVAASAPHVDPSAAVWGAVRGGPPGPALSAADLRGLAAPLAGLVVVGCELPPGALRGVRVPIGASDGDCLAAAIRELPPEADLLAWGGDVVPPDAWATAIAQLSAQLGDRDAAVFSVAVTDAVKHVRDGRIRGGVARDAICRPVPPIVVRAAAARAALLASLGHGRDPIPALCASGLRVRTVPVRTP